MSFFDDEIEVEGTITLEDVLRIWGDELIEQLKHSLDIERLGDSDLKKSLQYTITKDKGNLSFKLFFPDYGTYLDEGVAGVGNGGRKKEGQKNLNRKWSIHTPDSRFKFRSKRPPIEMLRKWAGEKGVNKWYLQEVIYRRGIKKREWFTDIMQQNPFEKLETQIAVQASKSIELEIVKVFSQGTENI